MTFPPLGHLIGAQKAATTSLAGLLAVHPEIRLSEPKETHFLTAEWHRGLDWWQGRFAPGGRVLVDASTTCAMLALPGWPAGEPPWGREPPARLARLRPDARLIYMVRDPADRLWSAYWHGVRSGWEKRPFARAIAESPMYLAAGDYAAQAEAWLAHFPRDALLFVDFREFRSDPAGVTRRCLAFLGVAAEDLDLPDERPRNTTWRYGKLGRAAVLALGGERRFAAVAGPLRRMLPEAVSGRIRTLLVTGVPPLPDEERARLREHYREPDRRLRALSGISHFG